MKRVLFYRDFRGFTGGHWKVWEYFQHVRATLGWEAAVAFTPETLWDESNPWLALRESVAVAPDWPADVRFVAGMDWERIAPAERAQSPVPVVNFLQHVRHADPAHPLHRFLGHHAIRVAVSEEVAAAITATGRAHGPVLAIPNGLDLAALPPSLPMERRSGEVLVAGLKQPALAEKLAAKMQSAAAFAGREITVQTTRKSRAEFLQMLAAHRVALFLPNPTEGFYLPALEAMALGVFTVCPDVIGNRSFCRPGVNSFRPPYDEEALIAATVQALAEPPDSPLLEAGRRTAAAHDLATERARFCEILARVGELW